MAAHAARGMTSCKSKQAPPGFPGGLSIAVRHQAGFIWDFSHHLILDCRRRSGSSSRAVASPREARPAIRWSFFHTGTLLRHGFNHLGAGPAHTPRQHPHSTLPAPAPDQTDPRPIISMIDVAGRIGGGAIGRRVPSLGKGMLPPNPDRVNMKRTAQDHCIMCVAHNRLDQNDICERKPTVVAETSSPGA